MGTKTALTVGDLLTLPRLEVGHYELSQGELIIVGNAGPIHERVKSIIGCLLTLWNGRFVHGWVYWETQFRLADDIARQPDVAFANHARERSVPLDQMVPNLAVEVISDSETAYSARKKVSEYLAAGVEEVWQVYPEIRLLIVHTRATIRQVSADELIESPVLPGFSARVAEFFEF